MKIKSLHLHGGSKKYMPRQSGLLNVAVGNNIDGSQWIKSSFERLGTKTQYIAKKLARANTLQVN